MKLNLKLDHWLASMVKAKAVEWDCTYARAVRTLIREGYEHDTGTVGRNSRGDQCRQSTG